MNVAYFGYIKSSEKLSGPEKFAKRIYKYALSKEIRLLFIDYFYGKEFSCYKKLFGSRIETIDDEFIVHRMGIIKMLFSLFLFKPDIIHLTCYDRSYIAAFIYKIFSKVKIINTMHGLVFHENKMFKSNLAFGYRIKNYMYEKIVWRFSDIHVLVSNIQRELISTIPFYKERESIKIIPNGVDDIFFKTNERTGRDEEINIAFVGDINRKEKGFAYFEQIANSTKENIRFHCISNMFVRNNKINIIPRQSVEEYKNILNEMDIYISPSIYESFQIVLVEAMASGVVPICSDRVGASYLINNGINGYVLSLDNLDKWNDILSVLNNDRKLLKRLSLAAKNSVEDLTWDNIFEKYYSLYKNTVAEIS